MSTLLRLLSTDRVNLAAPTASSKKKAVPDPDLLKNLYNLDELEAMSKEHNNILDLLVNHCGGTDEAVSRIRRVKAQVEKKNNLDKFCYDYDAEADSDPLDSPPCSQEENIKCLLHKRKDMDELKKRADTIKSRL
jgi:hypothetical protein